MSAGRGLNCGVFREQGIKIRNTVLMYSTLTTAGVLHRAESIMMNDEPTASNQHRAGTVGSPGPGDGFHRRRAQQRGAITRLSK